MIKLENLSIRFNRLIIDDVNIHLYPNEITLFVGESGSGKSSILNVLGLLDRNNKCNYYFYDKCIEDKDIEKLKREYISYVFQDYNGFDNYNIIDNFKAMYNIRGRKYNDKEVYELLKEVSLENVNLKLKAKSLSGGEKQRLAIALALVKQPKLLLLDEPTASLDEDNSNSIVEILHKLKDKGIMIAVSTHHPDIYNGDHIYVIEDKKLNEVHNKEVKTSECSKKDNNKFNIFKQLILNISNNSILSFIILCVFIFCIHNLLYMSVTLEHTNNILNEQLNLIADNEIMINNIETILDEESKSYFSNYYFPIEKEIIDEIKDIEYVDNIYPYYTFSRYTAQAYYDGEDIENFDFSTPDLITSGNKTISVSEALETKTTFSSCINEYQDQKCILLDESVEKGIYISNQLADVLNIDSLDHTTITLDFPILMGNSTSEGCVIYDDNTTSEYIPTRPMELLLKEMTFEIRGVYPVSATQNLFFDNSGGDRIYIDYRYMDEIHDEIVNDKELYNKYIEFLSINNLEDSEYYCNTDSSCYIVICDSYKHVDSLVSELSKYDNLYIKTKDAYGSLLKDMSFKNNSMMYIQPIVIYIVMVLLISFIYIYILRQRRKTLSFIYANGIHKAKLLPLSEILILLILSMPINYILVNIYMGKYSMFVLLLHIISILIIATVCTIINIIYYNKFDYIKQLRSQR